MRAIKIDTAGTSEVVEITEQGSLETLQKAVGGYIEILELATRTDLVIDEEGKFKSYERNAVADSLAAHFRIGLRPGDHIVGDVVIKGHNANGASAEIPAAVVDELAALGILPEGW